MKHLAIMNGILCFRPRRGAATTRLSGLLAVLLVAAMLCGHICVAFGAEPAEESASAEGMTFSDESASVDTPAEEAPATEGTESGDDGYDVTVHFGDDEKTGLHIHVNPETDGPETDAPETNVQETDLPETDDQAIGMLDDETEAETEAETEEETEAETEAGKKVYFYEDSKVSVTATLEKPDAVPDEAQFRVTEITPKSKEYNYDAYMDALNEKAEELAEQSAAATSVKDALNVTTNTYDETNTLLYDVAFIMQSYDEEGNAIEGAEYEYQPEDGAVDIRIEFKKSQLTDDLGISKEEDVTITHLPLSEKARKGADTTADATDISKKDVSVEPIQTDSVTLQDGGVDQADFQMDSFSVIAVTGAQQIQLTAQDYDAVSTDGVVGGSLVYGITANDWYFDNADSETSLAVGAWHGTGGQTGSNESKSAGAECQYILVGEVDGILHLKGYKAYITSPYTAEDQKISYGTDYYDSRLVFTQRDSQAIKDEVLGLIANAAAVSADLAGRDSIPDYSALTSGSNITLDFTALPDNRTYYINVENWDALYSGFQSADQTRIRKLDGQKIVFNFPTKKTATIYKYQVINKVGDTETTYSMDGLANMTTAQCDVLEDFIFNFPAAEHVETQVAFAGILLAPQARVDCYGVAGGWVICDQMYNHCEWHFTYDKVYEQSSSATLKAMKKVNRANTTVSGFHFRLEEKTGDTWSQVGEDVENVQSWITFPAITYDSSNCPDSRDFLYRISERADVTEIDGVTYSTDTSVYYAKVFVTKEVTGDVTMYKASSPIYYTDEACTQEVSTQSSLPEFNNTCDTYLIVNKKWFRGEEETGGTAVPVVFDLYRKESTTPPETESNQDESGNGQTASDSSQSSAQEGTITDFSMEVKWGNYNASNLEGSFQVHAGDRVHIAATSVSVATLSVFYNWPYSGGNKAVEGTSAETGTKTFVADNGWTRTEKLITTTFDYLVPAVEVEYQDGNACSLSGYTLQVLFSNGGTNDPDASVKVTTFSAELTDSGSSSGGSDSTGDSGSDETSAYMTHAQAQAQGGITKWDGESHRYEISAENGWVTTITSLPVSGVDENGEAVYYSYYVVEHSGAAYDVAETTYENNEGIQAGTITIRNKLPDLTYTYTDISVTKQWQNDAGEDITAQKSGAISFTLRQVLYHNSELVETSDREVYTGGVLQSTEGVSFDEQSGKYTLTAQQGEADENGEITWQWPTASITGLPCKVISEDGTVLYEYKYYVVEVDRNGALDAAYKVGSGSAMGYCEQANDGSQVTIINREMTPYALPATGGEGTRRVYLMSLLLIALAGVGLIMIRRRREMAA